MRTRSFCAILFVFTLPGWCGDPARTLHLKQAAEPNENAFTFLLPAGWRISGGIVRVNPLASDGALNAIGAKLDLTLASPDGKVALRWYPEMNYMDPRGIGPAAPMFPVGSMYNGARVYPVPNAFAFLDQGILRLQHPRASGMAVRQRIPLPGVGQSYQQVVRAGGAPFEFRYDVGLLIVSYVEGGTKWDELLYTAIQDFAQTGIWSNKDTFSARAPSGELENVAGLIGVILNSVQLNPRWVEGEIRGQMQRSEIAIRTQQEISRLDREIVEHRRRTNAEINNQAFHNLMRTEEYVNPHTKKVEIGSNEYSYRWVNERGEAIYTDDPNYDPARQGLTGYSKSPVRKRFPQ